MDAILIRREPAEEILDGLKTWEIRGSNTKKRGRVAIAISGTSKLYGEVDLVDSIPLTKNLWDKNQEKHRNYISWYEITSIYRNPHAWVMDNPQIYDKPKKYKHPYGAVIWVKDVLQGRAEEYDGGRENLAKESDDLIEGTVPDHKQLPVMDQNVKKVQLVYKKEDYTEFDGSLSHISADNFYDRQMKRVIKEAIADIVAIEGPISQPDLIRTMINKTSLGRAGKQITEYFDKLIPTSNVKITRQSGVRFLWNHSTNPEEYMAYRMRSRRNPEGICKYELKNAVCYLIQENGPMTKEEIVKAMVSMFGYGKSSRNLEDAANTAIKEAIRLYAVKLGDDKKYRNI